MNGFALQDLLPHIEQNLADQSQGLRRATLRLLLVFEQPRTRSEDDMTAAGPSDVLARMLRIDSAVLTLDSGHAAAAGIESIKVAIEFNRVPDILLAAVIRSLLGVLNVR